MKQTFSAACNNWQCGARQYCTSPRMYMHVKHESFTQPHGSASSQFFRFPACATANKISPRGHMASTRTAVVTTHHDACVVDGNVGILPASDSESEPVSCGSRQARCSHGPVYQTTGCVILSFLLAFRSEKRKEPAIAPHPTDSPPMGIPTNQTCKVQVCTVSTFQSCLCSPEVPTPNQPDQI